MLLTLHLILDLQTFVPEQGFCMQAHFKTNTVLHGLHL